MIYDDAQFTKRDWRNRNIIKTKEGLKWLSIPVEVKGRYKQKINETRVVNNKWPSRHWKTIRNNYLSATYFKDYEELFESSFILCEKLNYLSEINLLFFNLVNSILGIRTLITDTSSYLFKGDKNRKIISICEQANADIYVSGPSAKTYIDEKIFSNAGISIEWVSYESYPEYYQSFPPFVHGVSILDTIFHNGAKARSFMKSFK